MQLHPAARQNTNTLLELIEDGVLDKDAVIRACLVWMSDREVGEMARANDLLLDEEEDYNDSMDGDHESALASAGWGMDEDYGYSGDVDDGI